MARLLGLTLLFTFFLGTSYNAEAVKNKEKVIAYNWSEYVPQEVWIGSIWNADYLVIKEENPNIEFVFPEGRSSCYR